MLRSAVRWLYAGVGRAGFQGGWWEKVGVGHGEVSRQVVSAGKTGLRQVCDPGGSVVA